MANLHTKGIIIRKTNFGDNDVIFDLLSCEGNIFGFFARGARKMKSKFSGVIQLGQVVLIEYTSGKNLNYPNEISIEREYYVTFYSRSLSDMNFYTDVLTITRTVAKDFEDQRLFEACVKAFMQVEKGEKTLTTYNIFIETILKIIGIDAHLKCYFSGQLIEDEEFYYQPETNKVFAIDYKPKTIDIPLITYDEVFQKGYLKKLILEHINHKMILKF